MMKRVDVVSDNETMLRMLRAGLMLEDYDVHAIMINDYCFPQEEHIPDLLVVDVFLHAEQGGTVVLEMEQQGTHQAHSSALSLRRHS